MDPVIVSRTFSYSTEDVDDHNELMKRLREVCGHEAVVVTHLCGGGPFNASKIEFIAQVTINQIQMVMANMNRAEMMFETLQQVPMALNPFQRTFKPNPYIKDEDKWS